MNTIKIYVNDQVLDMSKESQQIELSIVNPLFSSDDVQSFSFPFTLPTTEKNRKLLGYIERIERITKVSTRVEARIECGSYIKNGKLQINGVSSAAYDVNFIFDSAGMWKGMGDTKLRELRTPEGTLALHDEWFTYTGYDYLISHLNNILKNPSSTHGIAVAPLVVGWDSISETVPDPADSTKTINKKYDVPLLINALSVPTSGTATLSVRDSQDVIDGELVISQRGMFPTGPHTIEENVLWNLPYQLPNGYGLAPLLYADFIFNVICGSVLLYGMDLSAAGTTFDYYGMLQQLIVAHNAIDILVETSGHYTLRTQDMLPDCTLREFMDALGKTMGGEFVLDNDTIKLLTYEQFLTQKPVDELLPYLLAPEAVEVNPPQKIVIQQNSSLLANADNARHENTTLPTEEGMEEVVISTGTEAMDYETIGVPNMGGIYHNVRGIYMGKYGRIPIFKCGAKWIKTALSTENNDDGSTDNGAQTKLSFFNLTLTINLVYGSPTWYFYSGLIPLKKESIYDRYKDYDRVLRSGGYTITTKLAPTLNLDIFKHSGEHTITFFHIHTITKNSVEYPTCLRYALNYVLL